jgi:SAM-dependent methyltransferase
LGVTSDSTIIDYGCGNGLYVDYLKDHGFTSVFGFDPYNPRFNDKKVLEKTYEVVISHDVIEHVDEAQDFLKTMIGLSKPEGLVVIGTPNASEIKLHDSSGPSVELSQPFHRHIFSEQALMEITQSYGFEPVQIYRRFYFDSPIPGVNVRFMWAYIKRCEGLIDVAVEPFRWGMVLRSPRLIFLALFGYLSRSPGNILISFKNKSHVNQMHHPEIKEAINA